MFVQVIQGQVTDAEQVHTAMDRWMEELAPEASGWLGTTAGCTADGKFIALARFDSADAARRNSENPAQDKWWHEFSSLLSDGNATFHDTEDVVLDLHGNPDSAGFVQIMQGAGSDPERARELMGRHRDEWAAFRPEVLGSEVAMYDAGSYTMAMYFTTEAEAREGERKEIPADLKADMDEMNALAAGPPDFYDLQHPWLYSPN